MTAPTYEYVDTSGGLSHALTTLGSTLNAMSERALCVDCEWDSHNLAALPLSLVQLSHSQSTVPLVIDAQLVPGVFSIRYVGRSLGEIFGDSTTVIVLHDARQDSVVLGKRGIKIGKCFDTSIAHEILTGEHQKGLADVMFRWLNIELPDQTTMKTRMREQHFWSKRPLDPETLAYSADDVRHLPALYTALAAEARARGMLEGIFEASALPRKSLQEQKQATAIAFGQRLRADEALRERCGDMVGFSSELKEWKDAERTTSGRLRKGGASEVFSTLLRMGKGKCRQLGLLRVTKEENGMFVYHELDATANDRAANVVYAVERMHEERERVEADKGGVQVTAGAFFTETIGIGTTVLREVSITNTNANQSVELSKVKLLKSNLAQPGNTHFSAQAPPLGVIAPGQRVTLRLECHPRSAGMLRDVLSIGFDTFSIGRYLEARAGDAALLEMLKPSAPYQRRKRPPPSVPNFKLDVDVPPPAPSSGADGGAVALPQGPKLKGHDINPSWRAKLRSGEAEALLADGAQAVRAPRGNAAAKAVLSSYRAHYEKLLWTEEIQLHADLTEFDFRADGRGLASLESRVGLFWLTVPGLAENRPSVLRGDRVRARLPDDPPNKRWEGVAERIELERVGLRFSQGFKSKYLPNTRLEVSFVLPRSGLRLFHQGLELVSKQLDGNMLLRPQVLFPEPVDLQTLVTPRNLTPQPLFNRTLNAEQVAGVRNICGGAARCVPYVLFGPPGTGKTTTLVEAILQCAIKLNPTAPPYNRFRILVVAPTNTAADFVTQKLVSRLNTKSQLLRLVAYSRQKNDILFPEVLARSNWDDVEQAFPMPTLDELLKPCVVVATLNTASKLYNQGVPRGHFDMICVDEAGQAIEPEAVAPVAAMLGESGQLVLAGDPKQLGPVIHHSLAKTHGLSVSLLERLMERPLYRPTQRAAGDGMQYDQRIITKLLDNYRSHPTLLELPNRLFYDGELRAKAAGDILVNSMLTWEGLPALGVPLLFDGIVGKDQREASSPSWFNADEAMAVLQHVKDVLSFRQSRVQPEDIGIITPYNKQVGKIRSLLRAEQHVDLRAVKVGSTELFQGQERRVIIISTVRSTDQFIDSDRKHNLGFLDNPKRFNVAVTRAQALLIVVGNPKVLLVDENWSALIRHCERHGAYRGEPLPPTDDGGGGGGGGGAGGHTASANAALAADIDELLRDAPEASERMQQEGMEMPEHE